MKKAIVLLMLLLFSAMVCSPLFSAAVSGTVTSLPVLKKGAITTGYEPYRNNEFTKWQLDLRRGECIFFGGIPLTYAASALGFALAGQEQDFVRNLVVAGSVSAVITVIDYILGVIREN